MIQYSLERQTEVQKKRHPDDIVLHEKLDNYTHLYSRRSEWLLPNKLSKEGRNPQIVLEFFEGEMKGEKLVLEKNLMFQIKQETEKGVIPEVKNSFSIGKDNLADYAFHQATIKKIQCIIEFNPMWGWQVKDPTGHQDVSRTSVYLANRRQMLYGEPSNFAQLFNKQILTVGDYDFEISARNTDPNHPQTNLFEDDQERFFEETEEDVRKQMTTI